MIKFDKFAIDSDEYCYIAGELKTRIAKTKDGTEFEQEYVAKPLYSTTLQGAIQAVLKREQRRLIQSGEYTLEQAVTAFDLLQQRFEDYLSKAKEEIK